MKKADKQKLMDVRAIITLPVHDGKELEQLEQPLSQNNVFGPDRRSTYRWSWIIENPLLAIKANESLARRTNVSLLEDEDKLYVLDLIRNTDEKTLKQLQQDGNESKILGKTRNAPKKDNGNGDGGGKDAPSSMAVEGDNEGT